MPPDVFLNGAGELYPCTRGEAEDQLCFMARMENPRIILLPYPSLGAIRSQKSIVGCSFVRLSSGKRLTPNGLNMRDRIVRS